MKNWRAFWQRVLSPQTARFVLAMVSLALAGAGAFTLLHPEANTDNSEAAIFAVGQLFGLATVAFSYYFGSTARNDERPQETVVVNPKSDPVHTQNEPEFPPARQQIDSPEQ